MFGAFEYRGFGVWDVGALLVVGEAISRRDLNAKYIRDDVMYAQRP